MRIGLIYEMNVAEAREYGRYVRGQDADTLAMYPAQEFLRVEQRRIPRTDWEIRWRAAGGKIIRGRMVALKSDAVWTNLSRFGRPYPPFDYGSGMGIEDIDRDEAIELGLLPADEPCDEIPDFDVAVEAEVSLERIPEDLREQFIKETPNAEVKGNKLIMRSSPKLPTWQDLGLPSAKTFKANLQEKAIDPTTSEQELRKGYSKTDPLGKSVDFEFEKIHWSKNKDEKGIGDLLGRLIRKPIADDCVVSPLEIWELPNGQRNYIAVYQKSSGGLRGVVVFRKPDGSVHSFFTERVSELNKARKGIRVYEY